MIAIIILWICVLLAILFIILLRTFELRSTTVSGNTRYSEEEMKRMILTKKTDQLTPLLVFRTALGITEEIPFVEKYEIEMVDRHTAEITVYEKMVIGCVEQMGNYLYFDKDGIIVESSKNHFEDIALITGLKFSKIVLHEKLVIQKDELYERVLNLSKLIQKQGLRISEIVFDAEEAVTLMMDGHRVFLGKKEYYDETLAVLGSIVEAYQKQYSDEKLQIDMSHYENGNGRITAVPLNVNKDVENQE